MQDDNGWKLEMGVGAALGLVIGGALGAADLLGESLLVLAAAFGVSLLLVGIRFERNAGGSVLASAASGSLGIVGGGAAITAFVGLVVGIFFLVQRLLMLPFWRSYWGEYPVTQQYLLQGIGTAATLLIISQAFHERDNELMNDLTARCAIALIGGFGATAAVSAAFVPFLPVIGGVELLRIPLATGLFGDFLGSLLGGAYGAVLAVPVTLFVDIVDGW